MGFFTRNQKGDEDDVPASGQAASAGGRRRANAASREDAAADDLRRRARRRLVGAIAMVLLAVIVLPMILDDDSTPPPENVAITIPSQNTPFQPNLTAPDSAPTPIGGGDDRALGPVSNGETGRVGGESTLPGHESQVRLPASIATITPLPGQQPPPPPTSTETRPETSTTPPAQPEPRQPPRATTPPPAPPPSTETRPQPNAAAAKKEAEAARALALLQGQPVPPAASSSASQASSRFAVQVVAVRSRDGAESLLQRLRSGGLTAYIESINTPDGQVHRVRLGPFNSRSQAESAQAKLRSLPGNLSGSLVPL